MAKEHSAGRSISVVSDWQSRSSKKQVRFFIILILTLAVAFAATAFSFLWSKQENYDLIVENNMNYLQVSGVQEADRIKAALDEGVVLISDVAKHYAALLELMPEGTIEERLQLLLNLKLFDRVGYVSADGTDITLEGVADVSDRDYFKHGMQGENGYDFLKSSRVTGRPCVVFYAPILEGDTVGGVMIGFFETVRMNDLFTMELYEYSPNAYLLMGDGSVISNSEHDMQQENMLALLATKEFRGDTDFSDIEAAIADSSRTSILFEYLEDEKPSVGVITQLQDCDWMVLSILPGDVTYAMIARANHIGGVLMYGISTVFVFLVIVMLLVTTTHDRKAKKEIRKTREMLQQAVLSEKKQTFIVDTLATTYHSVYLIDMLSGRYETIEERRRSGFENIAPKGIWQEAVPMYVNGCVDEPFRETMLKFLDITRFDLYIGKRNSISMEFMRTDGGWRKAFLLGQRDPKGKLLTVICAVQTIDEEKEKELLAQKALQEAFDAAQFASQAKTVFLSNMSHDIRTPMNAIIGMTMIASNNLDDRERVSDCLQKVNSSCHHLLGLINEILDMNKIESGRVELHEEAFSLTGLIEDLVSVNQVLVKERSHSLTVDLEDVKHPMVIGDKTRLQQVFTNLLTNAIKYTPRGGQLSIVAREDVSSRSVIGKYSVIFSDTGIGMSAEYMKTIFEPFTRARDERLIGIQGTGLGMPIARNIIRMMNGDITVESELDKGSRFEVTFMLKLQPEDALAEEESPEDDALTEVRFSGKRILLVEDNELNLEIATEILSMLGVEIRSVGNGKEAVECFTAAAPGEYDLILMDVQMPVMGGYEATAAIRASAHPEAKTIPIVAMTANAFSSDVREALDAGMNDHIAKPIDIGNLVRVLKKYIG